MVHWSQAFDAWKPDEKQVWPSIKVMCSALPSRLNVLVQRPDNVTTTRVAREYEADRGIGRDRSLRAADWVRQRDDEKTAGVDLAARPNVAQVPNVLDPAFASRQGVPEVHQHVRACRLDAFDQQGGTGDQQVRPDAAVFGQVCIQRYRHAGVGSVGD